MRTDSWNTVKATYPKVYKISKLSHQSEIFGEGSWLRAPFPVRVCSAESTEALETLELDLPTILLIKIPNYFFSSVDLAVTKCSVVQNKYTASFCTESISIVQLQVFPKKVKLNHAQI